AKDICFIGAQPFSSWGKRISADLGVFFRVSLRDFGAIDADLARPLTVARLLIIIGLLLLAGAVIVALLWLKLLFY
ncbi:hypothetical protein, partial [Pseudomonas sp. 3296]|uniref:hypothetical protein n=1 Tax=Pseudomonas sp. 3296 TaxID=2817753 RepID=UPI00286A9910